tara:strand:+ start:1088 stop:1519 length:432 start_codon:yes stop_codon:yes gene_type:complete
MKQKIKQIIEVETGVEDISIRLRSQGIVEARVIFSTLCLRHTKDSLQRIGKIINRDHSSIVHYRKIYNNWLEFPKQFLNNLTTLDRIDNIINEQKDITEEDIEIVTRYRRKNILLTKEIEKLKEILVKQEKNIERLKQYEPIW